MKIKNELLKEVLYQLEHNGVKGFYTRDEVYTALENAESKKSEINEDDEQ